MPVFAALCDRNRTPAKVQRRGIGKRVERCQRTVLRGQQAPENRFRMQGRRKRRSGGRSSRRTSGTKMPRCRSELPGARRALGREQRLFRVQKTGPTEEGYSLGETIACRLDFKDEPASIAACVRCRDLAVYDSAFPPVAAPRWAKASGRRILTESTARARYR